LSEEERAAFLRSPQLLNDVSFEPRVIKGASPYLPKTKKNSSAKQSEEEDGKQTQHSRRSSTDKNGNLTPRRSGDEHQRPVTPTSLQAVAEETHAKDRMEMEHEIEEDEEDKARRREASKIYQGIHRRYNSMHTLHLASVLHSPDVQEILSWYVTFLCPFLHWILIHFNF
jgi:hypothetical protein